MASYEELERLLLELKGYKNYYKKEFIDHTNIKELAYKYEKEYKENNTPQDEDIKCLLNEIKNNNNLSDKEKNDLLDKILRLFCENYSGDGCLDVADIKGIKISNKQRDDLNIRIKATMSEDNKKSEIYNNFLF